MVPKLNVEYYAVRSMFHISNISTLKSIYLAYIHSIIKYRIIFGVIPPTAERYFFHKSKSSELLVSAHPTTPYRSLFKKLQTLPIPCKYIFSVINFFVINQENFQIHQFTVLMPQLSTSFTHQRPTSLVSREVHSILASDFLTVYHVASQIVIMERHNLKWH
jgi:hypothetical protein